MSMKAPAHIGLLPQGGAQWIAGVIYLHNIIRALSALPEAERPTLHYFIPLGTTPANLHELDTDPPIVHYYTDRRNTSIRQKFRSIPCIIRTLQWPQSLGTVAVRTNARALFPLQGSLGQRFPVPWIGWIPDFQHKRLPDFFSEKERQHRDKQFQTLIDDASHIVVSSWDAYEDLMHWFPINSDRVSVFSFTSVATPRWYQQNPHHVVERFGLPEKYLMFPSQFWIHKNHRLLFEALSILRDTGMLDVSLVLTGQTYDYRWPEYFADLQNFINQQNLNKHVHILGLIDRQKQIQLLRCAAAVIQPSLFEGWSSLVEDCKTLGKRIYLSDLRVHREQSPQDSEYFNPSRAEELAELLARDWSTLKPGPDFTREKEAYAQHIGRATAFAESFLHIADRASGY